jgi:hypothetical protein
VGNDRDDRRAATDDGSGIGCADQAAFQPEAIWAGVNSAVVVGGAGAVETVSRGVDGALFENGGGVVSACRGPVIPAKPAMFPKHISGTSKREKAGAEVIENGDTPAMPHGKSSPT